MCEAGGIAAESAVGWKDEDRGAGGRGQEDGWRLLEDPGVSEGLALGAMAFIVGRPSASPGVKRFGWVGAVAAPHERPRVLRGGAMGGLHDPSRGEEEGDEQPQPAAGQPTQSQSLTRHAAQAMEGTRCSPASARPLV